MLKKLNYFINYGIISSILFIVLGGFMIIFPKTSLTLFSYYISIMGILSGIFLIILDVKNRNRFIQIDTMLSGILLLLFGILLLIYPEMLSILIPIILGMWFIISGCNKISMSVFIREFDYKNYIITLLVALLSIICGFVFIFNPLMSSSTITIVSGITLTTYAILSLVDTMIFKKHINKIVKEMKKRIKVIEED